MTHGPTATSSAGLQAEGAESPPAGFPPGTASSKAPPVSHRLSVRGNAFNVRVEGSGPWIVLGNSLATNLSLWDELVAALSDRFRIFRYDQRGHGGSAATPAPYSIGLLAGDLVALMDEAGIERAHYIGISLGGITGWALAREHRRRLLSLTVCDADMVSSSGNEWAQRLAIVAESGLEPLVEPTLLRWFAKSAMTANADPVRRVREMIRTTSVEGFVGCVNALQSFDYSQAAESLDLPVLLIAGEKDGTKPTSMLRDSQRIPGSRLAVIPEAGHLCNIENPAAFNRAVQSFLDGVAT